MKGHISTALKCRNEILYSLCASYCKSYRALIITFRLACYYRIVGSFKAAESDSAAFVFVASEGIYKENWGASLSIDNTE